MSEYKFKVISKYLAQDFCEFKLDLLIEFSKKCDIYLKLSFIYIDFLESICFWDIDDNLLPYSKGYINGLFDISGSINSSDNIKYLKKFLTNKETDIKVSDKFDCFAKAFKLWYDEKIIKYVEQEAMLFQRYKNS